MDGWMDGSMDGWMEEERWRGGIMNGKVVRQNQ